MQTAKCQKATEQLLAHLDDPFQHPNERDIAMRHIQGCIHCQQKIEYLVRAITTDTVDILTCQECQDRLPEYLLASAIDQARQAQWNPLITHLETCPHCSEAFATLSDLSELADGSRGFESMQYPEPNISFLRNKPATSRPVKTPWRLDTLGRLVIEFSAELIRSLQPPAYAAGLKSVAGAEAVLLDVADATPDLHVTIAADRTRTAPAHYTLSVTVNIPSRGGWPHLVGSEVILKRGDLVLATQTTDAFGIAVFGGIEESDLARLVFEITPAAGDR
jgi:hypothetical protein